VRRALSILLCIAGDLVVGRRRSAVEHDNMVERLRELFENAGADGLTPQTIEVRAGTIIETFINEALQINVKG
jgi:hypothetical protein